MAIPVLGQSPSSRRRDLTHQARLAEEKAQEDFKRQLLGALYGGVLKTGLGLAGSAAEHYGWKLPLEAAKKGVDPRLDVAEEGLRTATGAFRERGPGLLREGREAQRLVEPERVLADLPKGSSREAISKALYERADDAVLATEEFAAIPKGRRVRITEGGMLGPDEEKRAKAKADLAGLRADVEAGIAGVKRVRGTSTGGIAGAARDEIRRKERKEGREIESHIMKKIREGAQEGERERLSLAQAVKTSRGGRLEWRLDSKNNPYVVKRLNYVVTEPPIQYLADIRDADGRLLKREPRWKVKWRALTDGLLDELILKKRSELKGKGKRGLRSPDLFTAFSGSYARVAKGEKDSPVGSYEATEKGLSGIPLKRLMKDLILNSREKVTRFNEGKQGVISAHRVMRVLDREVRKGTLNAGDPRYVDNYKKYEDAATAFWKTVRSLSVTEAKKTTGELQTELDWKETDYRVTLADFRKGYLEKRTALTKKIANDWAVKGTDVVKRGGQRHRKFKATSSQVSRWLREGYVNKKKGDIKSGDLAQRKMAVEYMYISDAIAAHDREQKKLLKNNMEAALERLRRLPRKHRKGKFKTYKGLGPRKFLKYGLGKPRSSALGLPGYEKGGPVMEDGFLTDENLEPYARVHEGERVVPSGGIGEGVKILGGAGDKLASVPEDLFMKIQMQPWDADKKRRVFKRQLESMGLA